MVEEALINQIKTDLNFLISQKLILGVMLYGSYLNSSETNRSDIDICIIAPNEVPNNLLSFIWKNLETDIYDIHLFSELPLYIKIQIIEYGILIYSSNKYDLYEYFYYYRKLWEDQKQRQESSKDELLHLFD